MSWGVRIACLYTGFVLLIATMVGMSVKQRVDLVSKDYYDKELAFQTRLDESANSSSLSKPLEWKIEPGSIHLLFPPEMASVATSGEIFLMRPSDAALDKTLAIPAGSAAEKIVSTSLIRAGIYKMEISWQSGDKKYYNESVINIP